MRNRLIVLFAVAAGLWLAVPARAHHTASTLYADKTVTLKGTVKTWLWSNPHCLLTFDVKGDDGKVTPWMIEAAAPNALLRRGWTKQSLLAGTEIMVEGFQAKDGANRANGSIITYKDGKKLFVGSSGDGEGPPKQ